MQIKLDETNWADIKEVSELRRVDRKAINAVTSFEIDPATQRPVLRASVDDEIAEAVMKSVVNDWSLQLPLPKVDASYLDRLTLEQDTALREAIQPHINALQGNTTPVKANEVPTPDSAK